MYNKVIETLQGNAKTRLEKTATMEKYCELSNQVAYVCHHYPCEIGGYHDHDFYEINYVKKGECVNFVEGEVIYMPEGSFILLHTGTFHTLYAPDENSIIYNVLLKKEWFLETVRRYPLPHTAMGEFISLAGGETYPEYVYSPHSSEAVEKKLTDLCNNRKKALLSTEANVLFCLSEMLNEEDSVLSQTMKTSDKSMQKIMSYINQNFNSVTMESLSEYIGYSTTHIGRMFKKHIGKSFSEVVRKLRRDHAEYLLKFSNYQISEISAMIGYENVEHFCRIFKKDMGMSPREYRKNIKK